MNTKIENATPQFHRIIVPAATRMQIYIRHDNDAHGTRALCEVNGPATISCVEIERDESER